MLFRPSLIGTRTLEAGELKADAKACRKIGPAGIGEKALYLNSFYLRRRYYVVWNDVSRIFKRVAVSKGGFSRKGLFATIPYLVVELKDGREKACNFRFESQVDDFLEEVGKRQPGIPLFSEAAEAKLRSEREAQEVKYLKELSGKAQKTVDELRKAEAYLEEDPRTAKVLVYAAKQKRSVDGVRPQVKALAYLIVIASALMFASGLWLRLVRENELGLYLCLFAGAFVLSVYASQVLPTPQRNQRTAARDWDEAVRMSQNYIDAYEGGVFPVPACYAHPIVLERMGRAVREGRADDAAQALDVVKQDLRALNSSVRVSQGEYDEVVAIKPMFLVCGYA